VERIVEIKLESEEKAQFKNSIKAVQALMEAAKKIAPDLAN
jgi:malate dehydrogenase